jgi:hypothetical protein
VAADPDNPPDPPPTGTRAVLIRTVQTPLGYFVLVILVAEAILGVLAGISAGPDRTLAIRGVLGVFAVLTAVVAALAVWRPEALFGKRPSPTAPPPATGVLQLRPRWRSVRAIDGVEIRARWAVEQVGEAVTARVTATSGPYRGTVYIYRGTLRDRVLTLIYVAENPHLPDRGTLTARVSAAGDVLDGFLAFYSTAKDRVQTCEYRCEATR